MAGQVFISYSRRDDAAMRRIVAFLRKQGINVWVDNEKLVPGTPIWEAEIEKAIKRSSAVVVILSPDSKNSEWVRREITLADQYRTRIFPVLVRGDEDSSITIRLITRQFVDLRQNEEAGLNSLNIALSVYLQTIEAQEQKVREEAEKAAKEKAKREAAEKIAREKAEREAAEKATKENAEREAAEKAARERAKAEQKAKEEAERVAKQKAEEDRIEKAKAEAEKKSQERREKMSRAQATLRAILEKVIELAERITNILRPPLMKLAKSRLAIYTLIGIIVLITGIWGISRIPISNPQTEELVTEVPATSTSTLEPTPTPFPIDLSALAGTPIHSSHQTITPQNANQVVQLAHWGKGTINQLAYSLDGQKLYIASSIGLYSYNANSPTDLKFLEAGLGSNSTTLSAKPVFSPDRTVLAAVSPEGNVLRLWRVGDGALLQSLESNENIINDIVFSPNGNLLATKGLKSFQLWDTNNGKLLQTTEIGENIFSLNSDIAFSSDGNAVVSVTPAEIHFNADANTATISNIIRLWRASDGELLQTIRFGGGHSIIDMVEFSPDMKTFAISDFDNDITTIQLVNIDDGTHIKTFEGHIGGIERIIFSPDGSILATISYDNVIYMWRVNEGNLIQTLTDHKSSISNIVFSPDGTRLVTGSQSGNIHLWRVSDGTLLHTITGYSSYSLKAAFSKDVQTLAYAAEDDTILVSNISDGKLLQTLEGETGSITKVSLSPDGQTLASSSSGNSISIWDVNDGIQLHTLEGHTKNVTSIAFSPDGTTLASGSDDKTVRLWDTSVGMLIRAFEDQPFPETKVKTVAISPDGQTIASGMELGTVILWNSGDGTRLETMKVGTKDINGLAFSPDGKTLAVSSDDNTIQIWSTGDFTLLQTLEGHTSPVLSVAFSPDGQTVVSGAEDNTVRLWNATDGSLLKTLEGHTGSINNVAFSINGQIIISSSLDGTIRVWGIEK